MGQKRRGPLCLLMLILCAGFGAEILSLCILGGDFLDSMVYRLERFPDFFHHVVRFYRDVRGVYWTDKDACFPPLAYCIYYLFARILYRDNIQDPDQISYSDSGFLIMVMETVFFAVMFCCAFRMMWRDVCAYNGREVSTVKNTGADSGCAAYSANTGADSSCAAYSANTGEGSSRAAHPEKTGADGDQAAAPAMQLSGGLAEDLVMIILLFSYPFWIAIERGNMTRWVLILLMFAMVLRRSKKPAARETALILIAAAAALKLYPAIWGLLYLIEKRYKEAGRLVLYGLLLFFVPFAFFGGVAGFHQFLLNITAVGSGSTGVTIIGIFGRLWEHMGLDLAAGHRVGRVVAMLYLIMVVFLSWKNRKQTGWQSIAQITSLMIVFVAECGSYCLLYWTIPFLCYVGFLRSPGRQIRRIDWLYAVLFPLVFVAYPVAAFGSSGALYICLYLLLAVIMADQIHTAAAGRRPAGVQN